MLNNKALKTFVVINLGWLGDTLLTASLCKDIKLNYPESKVIFIASKPFEEIAKGMDGVDEVFTFDKKNKHKGLFGTLKFAKNFPYKNKVDCAFIVHSHERSVLLGIAIGAKIKISAPLKKSPLNLFITHKVKFTEEKIRNTYKADFNAEYLSILTGKAPQSKMSYSYPQEYDEKIKRILEEQGYSENKIIGICPVAKDDWRSFTPEFTAKFIEICNENSIKTMLVGAGKSADFAKEVKKITNVEFLDLTNKTTIFELSAFINACSVFLSVDTGPMHIAYSIGQKTVCAFYKKSMIEEWGPKSFEDVIILCDTDDKITPENCFESCKMLMHK